MWINYYAFNKKISINNEYERATLNRYAKNPHVGRQKNEYEKKSDIVNKQATYVFLGFFQKVQMSNVEQIESSGYVNDPVARLRWFTVRKLYNFLRGRQKLGTTCPRRPSEWVLTQWRWMLPGNIVLILTLFEMVFG